MTLRVPPGTDQTVQTAIHEAERRLRRLEKQILGIGPRGPASTETTIIRSVGGSSGGTVQLLNRIQELEKTVAEIIANSGGDDGLTLDDIPTLGPVGPSATRGLAPDPGLPEPPTGLASHVLVEDATWGYPYRGLVRVATRDDDTETGHDVVQVSGGMIVLGEVTGDVTAGDLHITGIQYPTGYLACFDEELTQAGIV